MQALIWGGAIAVCAAFAVTVFVVSGRGRPLLPEPAVIPVSPEVAPKDSDASPGPQPPAEAPTPALPSDQPRPPASGPATAPPAPPQELTEGLFIELSAQMLVAADSFTDSDVGRRSFERACEGILAQQGVSRADFDRMEEEIAQDPQRQARVVDRALERADQIRHRPTGVRAGTTPDGVVDPRRAPPPPPTPPR